MMAILQYSRNENFSQSSQMVCRYMDYEISDIVKVYIVTCLKRKYPKGISENCSSNQQIVSITTNITHLE